MGTLVATAGAPQWSASGWGRSPRLLRWFWLALLAHLAALWWLAGLPLPVVDDRPAISVELVPGRVPPPVDPVPVPPEAQPAPPPLERVPLPPETLESPAPSPAESTLLPDDPPQQVPTVRVSPAEAPADPVLDEPSPLPEAQDILKRLQRYRAPGVSRLTPAGPEPPGPPPEIGLANQVNMLTELNGPLPELPFAPGEMGLRFYSAGVRGDIARTFDRITPEFGFVTDFGLEVKCKYVLIIVSCGWRER